MVNFGLKDIVSVIELTITLRRRYNAIWKSRYFIQTLVHRLVTNGRVLCRDRLLCCSYNSNRNAIKSHLKILRKDLDSFSSNYEAFMVLGDFKEGRDNSDMSVFCDTYDFKCIIKKPTCYKNPGNLSWIDLMLTNNPKRSQSSCVVETSLSDFHRMTITVMKTTFKKFQPKIIHYRDYKNFQNDRHKDKLLPNS